MKFNRSTEIRSTLNHLHAVVSREAVGTEGTKAQEAIDRLAAELGRIYEVDFSDLEEGDGFGEIDYLRMKLDSLESELREHTSVEVDEGGKEVDSDGFCNTCGDQECIHLSPKPGDSKPYDGEDMITADCDDKYRVLVEMVVQSHSEEDLNVQLACQLEQDHYYTFNQGTKAEHVVKMGDCPVESWKVISHEKIS